ncbi:MAG: hypothetical protein CMH32_00990 [Micavibrio sp.]|nr:hypothetical protein [Micavibrio sp.]HCK32857.1 hypothetical protein [Rhodospirillaceae bacterium]
MVGFLGSDYLKQMNGSLSFHKDNVQGGLGVDKRTVQAERNGQNNSGSLFKIPSVQEVFTNGDLKTDGPISFAQRNEPAPESGFFFDALAGGFSAGLSAVNFAGGLNEERAKAKEKLEPQQQKPSVAPSTMRNMAPGHTPTYFGTRPSM